jgi:hypothetical protein
MGVSIYERDRALRATVDGLTRRPDPVVLQVAVFGDWVAVVVRSDDCGGHGIADPMAATHLGVDHDSHL